MNETRRESLILILLFVLTAALFRLPHLMSGWVAIDGDEAIVGLMARDLLQGESFPVFFYGQRYGLSLFEVLPLAAAFRFFGEEPTVIRVTMLLLWCIGGVFTVRGVQNVGGGLGAAFVGLVLATLPMWLGWSMKARGGYITAFLASQAAFWILTYFLRNRVQIAPAVPAGGARLQLVEFPERDGDGDRRNRQRTVLLGIGLGLALSVIAFAQPLFLVPLAPFLVFVRPLSAWMGLVAGFAVIAAPLMVRAQSSEAVWDPNLFAMLDPNGFVQIPFRLAAAFGGQYFYLFSGEPAELVLWSGRLFAAVGVLALAAALLSQRRDRWTDLIWASAVGILSHLLVTLWIRPDQFAFRYYLPLGVPFSLLVGLLMARYVQGVWGRRFAYVGSAFLFGLAAATAWSGRATSLAVTPGEEHVPERAATEALLERLDEHRVRHVFALDGMYQWNLIFESAEEVQARWLAPTDRVPKIAESVNRAWTEGLPTAVVGPAEFAPRLQEGLQGSGWTDLEVEIVADRHFFLVRPPRPVLDALRFRFDSDQVR